MHDNAYNPKLDSWAVHSSHRIMTDLDWMAINVLLWPVTMTGQVTAHTIGALRFLPETTVGKERWSTVTLSPALNGERPVERQKNSGMAGKEASSRMLLLDCGESSVI